MDLLDRLSVFSDQPRFIPNQTINTLAQDCAKSDEISEEQHDLGQGVCPLLIDDTCAIYAARPLACRAMVSSRDCRLTGYATMDPFILSVNNVLMQFAEHIDRDGLTGNLTDVLLYLSIKENRHSYQKKCCYKGRKRIARQPLPDRSYGATRTSATHGDSLKITKSRHG